MKPSLPQGTRDFDASTIQKRNFIFNTIRNHFECYGFMPLETPAFENLETLMGKYGDEGDKLIFKILNNGLENPDKHASATEALQQVMQGRNSTKLTERALKYDLTIPFARYVAMNFGKLQMPFKRYQIQPVWRADRPQRGRYREFYQCDADIVGSRSLWNENELVQLYKDVFKDLHIPVQICINNRKILAALATWCGAEDKLTAITVAIDKLDKIGLEKVCDELSANNMNEEVITKIKAYLQLTLNGSSNTDILMQLHSFFNLVEEGKSGLQELEYVLKQHPDITLDVTLARGLNYYTGTILEVKPLGIQMGSIGGGGRYDDLTGLFGVKDVPGVGISFGVDRIYDVMEELQLFPPDIHALLDVMMVNFGEPFEKRNREVLYALRSAGLKSELYPEASKFDKQLKYANKRGVRFVMMIGEDELQDDVITLKNFISGEQEKLSLTDCIARIANR